MVLSTSTTPVQFFNLSLEISALAIQSLSITLSGVETSYLRSTGK